MVNEKLLERVQIPKNLWECEVRFIPDSCPHKEPVKKYLASLREHIRDGNGLLLFGNYSRGKSGIGSIILKEALKYDIIGLWMPCQNIPGHIINEDMFDTENTWRRRIYDVPLLVIDEVVFKDNKADYFLDEVIRTRLASKLCTCLTTNYNPDKIKSDYPALYHALREVATPLKVDGFDFREGKANEMKKNTLG